MKDQKTTGGEYYLSLYKSWKLSGQSAALFCKEASVNYYTFRYWAKKFNKPECVGSGFTELQMSPLNASPVAILNFPAGPSLSFYQLPDAGWIKALLS